MARTKASLHYLVGNRKVVVTAYDSVGVEDCYDILIAAAIHRIATGENAAEPVQRDIKDWIIRSNLFV